MKIRKLLIEESPRVSALLQQVFPGSKYEVRLFENLHKKGKNLHEWICIHRSRVVAYIVYSPAYNGEEVCGLHLSLLGVSPQMQNQGIGTELLHFSLRQKEIRTKTLFVLGDPRFYKNFGFEPCEIPTCPLVKNNKHFLCTRQDIQKSFTVGYEPEFLIGRRR